MKSSEFYIGSDPAPYIVMEREADSIKMTMFTCNNDAENYCRKQYLTGIDCTIYVPIREYKTPTTTM